MSIELLNGVSRPTQEVGTKPKRVAKPNDWDRPSNTRLAAELHRAAPWRAKVYQDIQRSCATCFGAIACTNVLVGSVG